MKKDGEEHDMLAVDNSLVEFARHWADYYNEKIGSFRPEQNEASTEVLDAILYDMVRKNE